MRRGIALPLLRLMDVPFPGRWLGVDSDIARTVMEEWALWGSDPDYLMGKRRRESAENYAAISRPLLNVWIRDDALASYAANRQMLTWYAQAKIENWEISPQDLQTDRLGHFRLFGTTIGPRFWPRLLAWLLPNRHVDA